MISKKDSQQKGLDEIHGIMYLLRGENATKDGDYRSTHLGTVLEYLKSQNTEEKSVTLQKLALMLGMAQRQIRENYFDGLLAFGIISLDTTCSRWRWIGIKAVQNQYGKLRKNTPEDNEYVSQQLTEPEETATGYMQRKGENK